MKYGDKVTFTAEELGLMRGQEFTDLKVTAGDVGEYVSKLPSAGQPAGGDWHLIAVAVDGETLYCPAQEGMFTL